MSEALLLATVLVLLAALGLMVVARIARRLDRRWPFVQTKPLSDVEQVLFHRLVQALPQHFVLAQVPMARFLRVRKGQPVGDWIGRIDRKTVDYLVCKPDLSIVAAVELDHATPGRARRSAADLAKNRALAAAGVPLVRWHVSALPDFDAIRTMLDTVVKDRSGGTETLPRTRIEPVLRPVGLHATLVEASNDPAIAHEEKLP